MYKSQVSEGLHRMMKSDVINPTLPEIVELLRRSDELSAELGIFIGIRPYDESARIKSSCILCGVSLEHAGGVRVLINSGTFTSALGVLRMQYEALVKAVWAFYAASDNMIGKLQSDLNTGSVNWADNIPSLKELLSELEENIPRQVIGQLLEFKEYSWKPLSSYVHGGIHAITRHGQGYPAEILVQAVKLSNGLQLMAAMMLIILSGDTGNQGKLPGIQQRFSDCCPSFK